MPDADLDIARRRSDSARAKGRSTLTRAEVVRAGIKLLDTDGVEKLSMRRLAAALGTGPSTLYWHVKDKDELLLAILDDSVRDIAVHSEGEWDVLLLDALVRCYEILIPRPALVDVLWSSAWQLGPEILRVADGLIALIARSGLPHEEVADAYVGVIGLLYGFAGASRGAAGNPRFSESEPLPETLDTLQKFPHLLRFGPAIAKDSLATQFIYAIERLIAGIKVRVAELS